MEPRFDDTSSATDFRTIAETIRRFMRDEVLPNLGSWDDHQEFPRALKARFAELGFLTLIVPRDHGGMGLSLTELCRVIEELARYDASMAVYVQSHATALRPILLGADAQLRRWAFHMVADEDALVAFAITEPGSGSDAASIRTVAQREAHDYVLNGSKMFITNGGVADYYLVFAKTDPAAGHRGISAFLVDATSPGLEVGAKENKLGLRTSMTTPLYLDGVHVPAEHRVGEEGQGFSLLMRTLNASRPTIGAQAVGVAQGALDDALLYARDRQQFGQAIIDFQAIQFMLADMAMQVEAARSLLYRACGLYEAEDPMTPMLSAMSKAFASDVAMRVATDAVQIYGGYGVLKTMPVERRLRDAKVTQIYEGTNQIQRVIIAKHLMNRAENHQ